MSDPLFLPDYKCRRMIDFDGKTHERTRLQMLCVDGPLAGRVTELKSWSHYQVIDSPSFKSHFYVPREFECNVGYLTYRVTIGACGEAPTGEEIDAIRTEGRWRSERFFRSRPWVLRNPRGSRHFDGWWECQMLRIGRFDYCVDSWLRWIENWLEEIPEPITYRMRADFGLKIFDTRHLIKHTVC